MAFPSAGGGKDEDAVALRREQVRKQAEKEAAHRKLVRAERLVLIPLLVIALLAWPNFGIAKVVGRSMEPRYHTGDTLVLLRTYRYFSLLHVGDVVVIKLRHGKLTNEQIVKRVVFVQNATGNAPWPKYLQSGRGRITAAPWFPRQVSGVEPVPIGGIMVMGDNLMNSTDSRDFGPVFPSEIIGKVLNP